MPSQPGSAGVAAHSDPYGPRLLLWVWDRAEGSLDATVPCAEFGTWQSIPGSLVRTIVEQFAAQDMLRIHPHATAPEHGPAATDDPAATYGTAAAHGTTAAPTAGHGTDGGVGPVVQLLPDGAAEARVLQVRRADPAERGRYARTAVLHWIYARGDRRLLRMEEFFDSPEVFFLGETLARGEISRTLGYLAEAGLVACEGPEFHNGVGSHVALTALGEDAVLGGGDIGDFVAQQRALNRPHTTILEQPVTHVVESGNRTEATDGLVRLLRERVPTLAMDEESRRALLASAEALAHHHSTHGDADEPQRDQQRGLMERMRTLLGAAPDSVGRQLVLDAVGQTLARLLGG